MKKIFIVAALFVLFSAIAYCDESISPTEYSAELTLDLIKYDPAPALPGAYLNMYVYVKNNSNYELKNVIVTLDLSNEHGSGTYPFSFDSGEEESKTITSLKQYQTALFEFRVKVDSEAPNGSYRIKIGYGKDNAINKSQNFYISVLNRRPQVEIIESSPTEASPGKTVELELTLRNIGSDKAFDVLAGVEEDRTVTSTGVVVERKFSASGSSLVYVGELASSEEKKIRFKLGIDPDAELKSYSIPLSIKYLDSNRNSYSVTRYVGILLKEDAEVDAVISSITPKAYAGGSSEIVIDLFNIGSGDAKYVVAELSADNASFETSKIFIGTLEPDDFDSFKTKITLSKDVKERQIPLNLKIKYKDAYSNPKEVEKTFMLNVYPESEAVQSQGIDIWFVIVVLMALYLVGKRVYKIIKKK